MILKILRVGALICAGVLLAESQRASASLIPLGLDANKNVFVQEYWENGAPYYLVFNLNKASVEFSVHAAKGNGGAALTRPVRVPPLSVGKVDISAVVGQPWLDVFVNGASIGLFDTVLPPPAQARGTVSSMGLNDIGGRSAMVWVEHSGPSKADRPLELRLHIVPIEPTKSKEKLVVTQIHFKRQADPSRFPETPIQEILCDSLPVKDLGGELVIDVDHPLKPAAEYVATLRFKRPAASRLWAVIVGGAILEREGPVIHGSLGHMTFGPEIGRTPGGRFGIVRGIPLEP